jgi:spore photoproduct lyase
VAKVTLTVAHRLCSVKRGKHGATKFVYPMPVMRELRMFFERELGQRLPQARTLYWT